MSSLVGKAILWLLATHLTPRSKLCGIHLAFLWRLLIIAGASVVTWPKEVIFELPPEGTFLMVVPSLFLFGLFHLGFSALITEEICWPQKRFGLPHFSVDVMIIEKILPKNCFGVLGDSRSLLLSSLSSWRVVIHGICMEPSATTNENRESKNQDRIPCRLHGCLYFPPALGAPTSSDQKASESSLN